MTKSSAIVVTTSASLERPKDDDIIGQGAFIGGLAMLQMHLSWQRDDVVSASLRLVASRAVPQRKG
jgi:hypothetical protein